MVETHVQWDSVQRHAHLHTIEDITVGTVIKAVTGHCCVHGGGRQGHHHTLMSSNDARSTFVTTNYNTTNSTVCSTKLILYKYHPHMTIT